MIGKTLSHYRIVEELGRGGMGIVYKAEDTKLDRTVAIKVLPSAALASEDDRARFYREAKAAAQLHHPNIASVFEIDEAAPSDAPHGTEPSPFIAMEYIEGDTLEERIKKGPFKLREAVRIAGELAEGLKAAHAKDIVHRDIKAANVMLDMEGRAKILDFGLAKTSQSTKLTRMGSTLGTIAYMSPEQARGEEVDARTDIWAVGATLYEMVAGRSAFAGDYEQAVVYSILNEMPEPLTAVRTGVPMALEWIVVKCLAKDAKNRYQRAEDLLIDLRNVDLASASGMSHALTTSGTVASAAPPPPAARAWYRSPVALASVFLAFLAGMAITFSFTRSPSSSPLQPVKRFTTSVPGLLIGWFPRLSPDGSKVAYFGLTQDFDAKMLVYDLSTGQSLSFGSGYSAGASAFSSDGRQLIYGGSLGLSRISLEQGIPLRISTAPADGFVQWLDQETVLLPTEAGDKVFNLETRDAVDFMGSEFLAGPDALPEGMAIVAQPSFIPEQKAALATAFYMDPGKRPDVVFIKDGSLKIVYESAAWPKYSRAGFLTYTAIDGDDFQRGRLMSQLFSPADGTQGGVSVPVVADPNLPFWRYDVSDDGTIWISDMGSGLTADRALAWIDPVTHASSTLSDHAMFDTPSVSPDGSTIAFQRWNIEANRQDVFLYNVGRGTEQLFQNNVQNPVWSPDGRKILFYREQGEPALLEAPVDRSSEPVPLFEGYLVSFSLSPDGKRIAFSRAEDGEIHLYVRDSETGDERPIDATTAFVADAQFSPDGQFIVAKSGPEKESEMVVYPFSGGLPIPVSGVIGQEPHWSTDGAWIYFISDDQIQRVPVLVSNGFDVLGPPETVSRADEKIASFSIAPDGRILAVRLNDESYPDDTARVIQNWGDELRRQSRISGQ